MIYLWIVVCPATATIINFDDISAEAVPSGYNNLVWTNGKAYTTTASNGYYTGAVSRPNSVMNPNGTPMTIASANSQSFTLYSLVIAAAWYDDLQLTVVGYKSNIVIATSTFTLQVFTASYLSFSGFSGLDKVIFTTSGGTKNSAVTGSGTHFSMDNICLTFT